MKTFKVITQTFMDENSEHFFWGAEEDISEIKRGDIMAIESKQNRLKISGSRDNTKIIHRYRVFDYHHMARERKAPFPEDTKFFKSLPLEAQTKYKTILKEIWSGKQRQGGIPQRHYIRLKYIGGRYASENFFNFQNCYHIKK